MLHLTSLETSLALIDPISYMGEYQIQSVCVCFCAFTFYFSLDLISYIGRVSDSVSLCIYMSISLCVCF